MKYRYLICVADQQSFDAEPDPDQTFYISPPIRRPAIRLGKKIYVIIYEIDHFIAACGSWKLIKINKQTWFPAFQKKLLYDCVAS